jgi:hypothetical protein
MKFSGIEALQHTDTSPEAAARYAEALRRASPGKRLRRALELSELTRRLSFEALRARHPELDAEALRAKFVEQVYGPEAARRYVVHRSRGRG